METVQSLIHDHALLRKKLVFLESALQVAPEARFVLREMCFSLQRLLQEHVQREARALSAFQPAMSHDDPSHARDHTAAQHLLRTINELLLSGMRASMPTVVIRLSQFIDQMKAQMEEQERALFPISGAMSANEIVQRYPGTGPLLEQELHINRLREGYESVDELAWRHGMDVAQVIERLRQAVFSGE